MAGQTIWKCSHPGGEGGEEEVNVWKTPPWGRWRSPRGAIRVCVQHVLNTTTSDPRAASVVKTTPGKNKAITHKWHASPGERMG